LNKAFDRFMFSGVSALSLDTKGRMTVPARYREALAKDSSGQIALIESDVGCLLLMPQSRWSEKVEALSAEETDDERRRFWLGLSDTPELDTAGRVLINPVLREGAGISREVMLLGLGAYFELWDPTRLAHHKEQVRARKLRGAV
jgi:MraZ protein